MSKKMLDTVDEGIHVPTYALLLEMYCNSLNVVCLHDNRLPIHTWNKDAKINKYTNKH